MRVVNGHAAWVRLGAKLHLGRAVGYDGGPVLVPSGDVRLPWLLPRDHARRGSLIVNSLYSPTLLSIAMLPRCCWVMIS